MLRGSSIAWKGPLWTTFRGPAAEACVDLASLLLRKTGRADRPPFEEALDLLERAAGWGWADRDRLRDPEFAPLSDLPRFQALLGE